MTEVKGFAVRGLLRFIKESGHPGGIPAILDKLGPDDRSIFEHPINGSTWYPYHVFTRLIHIMDETIGRGDRKLARRIGEVSAQADVHGVFKIISALTGFQTLLPRAPLFWPRYFSAGKLVMLDITDRGARMQIHDFPDIDPIHCVVLEGWFEKIGSLFGAKDVRVSETACVHRGSPVCEYKLTYS